MAMLYKLGKPVCRHAYDIQQTPLGAGASRSDSTCAKVKEQVCSICPFFSVGQNDNQAPLSQCFSIQNDLTRAELFSSKQNLVYTRKRPDKDTNQNKNQTNQTSVNQQFWLDKKKITPQLAFDIIQKGHVWVSKLKSGEFILKPRLKGGMQQNSQRRQYNDLTEIIDEQFPIEMPKSNNLNQDWNDINKIATSTWGKPFLSTQNLLSTDLDIDIQDSGLLTIPKQYNFDTKVKTAVGIDDANIGQVNQHQFDARLHEKMTFMFQEPSKVGKTFDCVTRTSVWATRAGNLQQLKVIDCTVDDQLSQQNIYHQSQIKDQFEKMSDPLSDTKVWNALIQPLKVFFNVQNQSDVYAKIAPLKEQQTMGCSFKNIALKAVLDYMTYYQIETTENLSTRGFNFQDDPRNVAMNAQAYQYIGPDTRETVFSNTMQEIQNGKALMYMIDEIASDKLICKYLRRYVRNESSQGIIYAEQNELAEIVPTASLFQFNDSVKLVLMSTLSTNTGEGGEVNNQAYMPDLVVVPKCYEIIQFLQNMCQNFGQQFIDDMKYAFQHASMLLCGFHSDVTQNRVINNQTVTDIQRYGERARAYLAYQNLSPDERAARPVVQPPTEAGFQTNAKWYPGTFQNKRFYAYRDYTYGMLGYIFVEKRNYASQIAQIFTTQHSFARRIYLTGMAMKNSLSLTLSNLSIDFGMLQYLSRNSYVMGDERRESYAQQMCQNINGNPSVIVSKWSNIFEAMYELQLHDSILRVLDLYDRRADNQVHNWLETFQPSQVPNIEQMFDTYHVMKRGHISQLYQMPDRSSTVKHSSHCGVVNSAREIQLQKVKTHDIYISDSQSNRIITDGGASYNCKAFLKLASHIMTQNSGTAYNFDDVINENPLREVVITEDGNDDQPTYQYNLFCNTYNVKFDQKIQLGLKCHHDERQNDEAINQQNRSAIRKQNQERLRLFNEILQGRPNQSRVYYPALVSQQSQQKALTDTSTIYNIAQSQGRRNKRQNNGDNGGNGGNQGINQNNTMDSSNIGRGDNANNDLNSTRQDTNVQGGENNNHKQNWLQVEKQVLHMCSTQIHKYQSIVDNYNQKRLINPMFQQYKKVNCKSDQQVGYVNKLLQCGLMCNGGANMRVRSLINQDSLVRKGIQQAVQHYNISHDMNKFRHHSQKIYPFLITQNQYMQRHIMPTLLNQSELLFNPIIIEIYDNQQFKNKWRGKKRDMFNRQLPIQVEMKINEHDKNFQNLVISSGCGYHATDTPIEQMQDQWYLSPVKENVTYRSMTALEQYYKQGKINRETLARWRNLMAPSCLTHEDYYYLPQVLHEMWNEIVLSSRKIVKFTDQNMQINSRMQNIIFGDARFSKLDIKNLQNQHKPINKQQHTRIKLDYKMLLVILKRWVTMKLGKQRVESQKPQSNMLQIDKMFDCVNMCSTILFLLSSRNDWHQTAVTTMIIAIIGDDSLRKQLNVMSKLGMFKMDLQNYIKTAKQLHNYVRKTGFFGLKQLSCEERVRYQYLQDLAGRGEYEVNFEQEMQERIEIQSDKLHIDQQSGEFTNDQFTQSRNQHLYQLFRQLDLKNLADSTFREFILKREEWVKSGSALGAKITHKQDGEKDQKIRLNKRGAVNMATVDQIEKIFNKFPMTVASIVKKYENGKCRALYPTKTDHYLMESYAIQGIEDKLNQMEDIGINQDSELSMIQQAQMMNQCQQQKMSWCWDFDNFNQSHTRSDQYQVFNQQRNVYIDSVDKSSAVDDDKIRSLQWCADSKLVQCVRADQSMGKFEKHRMNQVRVGNPNVAKNQINDYQNAGLGSVDTSQYVQTKQGLYSGSRTTDYVNTILNKVQINMVDECVQKTFKRDKSILVDAKHKGDDVKSHVDSWLDAVLMNVMCKVCGHTGSDMKILIDNGVIEFLRKMTLSDGIVRGFLKRSIPNIISKDMQGEDNARIDPVQMLAGIKQQMKKVVIRGYDLNTAKIIEQALIDYWQKTHVDGQLQTEVDKKIASQSVSCGGLGQTSLKDNIHYNQIFGDVNVKVKIEDINLQKYMPELKNKASQEYVQHVRSSINEQMMSTFDEIKDQIVNRLHNQDILINLPDNLLSKAKGEVQRRQQKQTEEMKKRNLRDSRQHAHVQVQEYQKQATDEIVEQIKTIIERPDDYVPQGKSICEKIQSLKAACNIKRNEVYKMIFDSTKNAEIYDFALKMFGEQPQLQQIIRQSRYKVQPQLFKQMLFSSVNLDMVADHNISDIFIPLVRRLTENWLDQKGILMHMDVQKYQINMREIETDVYRQLSANGTAARVA